MGRGEQADGRGYRYREIAGICLTMGAPVLPCWCPLDYHPYCLVAPSFQVVLQSFLWENTVPAGFQGLGARLPYLLQSLQPGEHHNSPVSAAQSELEGQEGLCLVPQLTAAHAYVICVLRDMDTGYLQRRDILGIKELPHPCVHGPAAWGHCGIG